MAKARRQYDNEYPSVTTILGVLRKVGLEMWFKFNTLAFINKESEEGKTIGTQIHEAIQQHIEQEEVKIETAFAEQVSNALKGFMQFKVDHPEIKLRRAEMMLTSEKHQFNGTLDCIGKIGKDLVLLDWKTSKAKSKEKPDIYDEYRYQVAAYVKAFNETQEGQVTRAFILSLAKDKIAYNFEEIAMKDIDEMFEQVFLPALSIYNYGRKK
jgi:ATP-dependent exoDNAse (exonuclease V) beta subunit